MIPLSSDLFNFCRKQSETIDVFCDDSPNSWKCLTWRELTFIYLILHSVVLPCAYTLPPRVVAPVTRVWWKEILEEKECALCF